MIVGAAILAFALAQSTTPAGDDLRRAKNEYSYGNYAVAADHLRSLLYPMRLITDEQVIEARKLLALCYYQTGQLDGVGDEFRKLLYLDPDYKLDPFEVPPPIVDDFERVREKLQPELDVIRQRKSDVQLAVRLPKGVRRVVTSRAIEHSALGTFLPFGVGQFQNGETRWGVFFAATELLLLAANIAAYVGLLQHRGYFSNDDGTRTLVQRLTLAQYGSAGLFGVTWALGVYQAQSHFVPVLYVPPEVHDEPITFRQAGRSIGLSFRF